jgi:hypothetical protein
MDIEERQKLYRILEVSEENNQMLKTMLRNMRWGRLIKTVYWVVIIGASVGAFYYTQTYFDQLLSVYGGAKSDLEGLKSFLGPGQ